MIDVAVRRLRDDAVLPRQAYEGDAGLDLSSCEHVVLSRASARRWARGSQSRSRGLRRVRPARSGLAARHGIGVVNSPGSSIPGYRGEIRVVLLNTDAQEPFAVEPGMRIAQLVIPRRRRSPRRGRQLSVSARGEQGFGSSAREHGRAAGPSSAILRWRGRILLLRHEKGQDEVWLLPGGGVRGGESLLDALQRELWEETGLFPEGTEVPLEGPVALVDSIAPPAIRAGSTSCT